MSCYDVVWIHRGGHPRLVCWHGGTGATNGWLVDGVDLITGERIQFFEHDDHPPRKGSVADVEALGLDTRWWFKVTGDSGHYDPWWDQRQRSPEFNAVLKTLIANKQVVYYSVDWRPFLFPPTCPAEETDLARARKAGRPVRDPRPICGSMSKPYMRGGGGYLERFAGHLNYRPPEKLSECVRRKLHEDFDREQQPGNWVRSKYGPDVKCKITDFKAFLRKMGWTKSVFDEIDRRHEQERNRLRRELRKLGLWPEFEQLSMELPLMEGPRKGRVQPRRDVHDVAAAA